MATQQRPSAAKIKRLQRRMLADPGYLMTDAPAPPAPVKPNPPPSPRPLADLRRHPSGAKRRPARKPVKKRRQLAPAELAELNAAHEWTSDKDLQRSWKSMDRYVAWRTGPGADRKRDVIVRGQRK